MWQGRKRCSFMIHIEMQHSGFNLCGQIYVDMFVVGLYMDMFHFLKITLTCSYCMYIETVLVAVYTGHEDIPSLTWFETNSAAFCSYKKILCYVHSLSANLYLISATFFTKNTFVTFGDSRLICLTQAAEALHAFLHRMTTVDLVTATRNSS